MIRPRRPKRHVTDVEIVICGSPQSRQTRTS
jgi:hypothetical protein